MKIQLIHPPVYINENGLTALRPSLPLGLAYIAAVQEHLRTIADADGVRIVGGMTAITDILRKVGAVALDDPTLPASREQASQYMFLYESGDPDKGKDMWKFITPGDSRHAQMWMAHTPRGSFRIMAWPRRVGASAPVHRSKGMM